MKSGMFTQCLDQASYPGPYVVELSFSERSTLYSNHPTL